MLVTEKDAATKTTVADATHEEEQHDATMNDKGQITEGVGRCAAIGKRMPVEYAIQQTIRAQQLCGILWSSRAVLMFGSRLRPRSICATRT